MNKKHNFDFLLLNSFGTKNERFINNIINILLNFGAFIVGFLGLFHCFKITFPFAILMLLNLYFVLICVIFIYVNVIVFINGHSKKPLDNVVLVCKRKSKIYHRLFDVLDFVIFVGFFFAFMVVAVKFVCPAVFGIWLWFVYFFKPFLLKEVVLYEHCVIVRYRILGNVRLGLENLALIGEGFRWDNQTFARAKKENGAVKIWVIFNSIDIWDRLENKAQLKEWLDKKLGFSVDKILFPSLFGLDRKLKD